MSEAQKSKRRCPGRRMAQIRSGAIPSAVHYVGYVEDDETPEMIMRKFEEMERIVHAGKPAAPEPGEASQDDNKENAAAGESREAHVGTSQASAEIGADGAALSEEQLMEVFKQTSMFNVKSALANNDCMLNADAMFERAGYGTDDDKEWEEFRDFWSDDEDWTKKPGRKRATTRRVGPVSRPAGANSYAKPKSHTISTYNSDSQSFIRRNVKAAEDPLTVHLIKIPPAPLPRSWGRTVKPWRPPDSKNAMPSSADQEAEPLSCYQEEEAIASSTLKPIEGGFQAVFINSGWEETGGLDCLRQLPIPKLCPVGFVFIWLQKALVHPVISLMYRWGYVYVENLTWVQTAPSNAMLELESDYFRRSHLTLYIFRKSGEGKDIELKHQRNPDVAFDCIRTGNGRGFQVPEEIFEAIETLLPSGKGKFLELWAERGVRRSGWTHVVETSR